MAGNTTGGKLRDLVSRAFSHGDMLAAAKSFQTGYGGLPDSVKLLLNTVSPDLSEIAQTFVELQQARHDADYNQAHRLTRTEAAGLVQQVKDAFALWKTVRKLPETKAFLFTLLLGQRWKR